MVQFPFPLLLKKATSEEPGTEAPPAPPEEVDQLAVLFQLAVDEAIQYLEAAWSCIETEYIKQIVNIHRITDRQ